MDSDVQVVPGGPPVPHERAVPFNTAPKKNFSGKSGLTRVSSVTNGLAGYGVVMGNGPGLVGMNGVVPQHGPQAQPVAVPGTYGVVGVPFPYHGIPAYAGPGYQYGCVSVAPRPADNIAPYASTQKTAQVVEKLPEVTSGTKKKPRWSTPRRRGNWREEWECAKNWAPKSTVDHKYVKEICEVIRCTISDEVSSKCKSLGVGRPTVEKWMCLLAEYLELNGDEHVLLAILLARYGKGKRGWMGNNDWCRPQRWECVVALAAYMAVLLSEEFPGKVAQDLQELLGRNFRFGKEQVAFLLAVEWRVNVDEKEFNHVRMLVENAAKEIERKLGVDRMKGPHFARFAEWFSGIPEVQIPAKTAAAKTKTATAKKVETSPITPISSTTESVVLGKKRAREPIMSYVTDEPSVPDKKRRAVFNEADSPFEYDHVGIVPCAQEY